MGMFDYVVIDEEVSAKLDIPNVKYQTKDMHRNMDTYLLKFRKDGLFVKLYLLDPPSEEKCHKYSEEEKKCLKKNMPHCDFEEYWEEGAWDIENRYPRDMGEIPNGTLELCADEWPAIHNDLSLTFSDGLLKYITVIHVKH